MMMAYSVMTTSFPTQLAYRFQSASLIVGLSQDVRQRSRFRASSDGGIVGDFLVAAPDANRHVRVLESSHEPSQPTTVATASRLMTRACRLWPPATFYEKSVDIGLSPLIKAFSYEAMWIVFTMGIGSSSSSLLRRMPSR